MKRKTDLRVLRTKKMIFESFIRLVEKEGYDNITVQQIADEAMINRATFYAHFKDKQDLYDSVFDFAMGAFLKVLDTNILTGKNQVKLKTIEGVVTRIFVEIKKNKQFFILITEGSRSPVFVAKLNTLLAERYAKIFQQLRITENDIEVPVDFIIEYMTSVFMGTVHWWIHSESDFTAEHMARLVIRLVGNGHLTVLGIEVLKED